MLNSHFHGFTMDAYFTTCFKEHIIHSLKHYLHVSLCLKDLMIIMGVAAKTFFKTYLFLKQFLESGLSFSSY